MSLGWGEELLPGPQHLQEAPSPLPVSRLRVGGLGLEDWEESGIRGGWWLELSFFHGGAVREGAFEESELMRGTRRESLDILASITPQILS